MTSESKSDHGRSLLAQGITVANEVVRRKLAGTQSGNDAAVLGGALETLRSATNWLEDTEEFEVAHQALDHFGRVRRRVFPDECALAYRDGSYHQRCPVALAHNRMGVSIGAIIEESECSVCGLEPDDDACSHISGRFYDGQECGVIVRKFSMDHVALVEKPDFPDARLTSWPLDLGEMCEELGHAFTPGMQVTCDRCLSDCPGVYWPMRRLSGG